MKTKTNIKPNYTTTKTLGGRQFNLILTDKDENGRIRSASCEYPLYLQVANEKGDIEVVKQSKKQTEKYLLKVLGY